MICKSRSSVTVVGVFIILSLLNLSHCSLQEVRKFTTVVNPHCEDGGLYPVNCSSYTNMSLIHIRSDGKDDSYHFLWSFMGAPTLLMARTPLASSLSVDWIYMLQSQNDTPAIKFNPEPFYSFGWGLVKIWVADDKHDQVVLDKMDQNFVKGFRTKNFQWERVDNESYANTTHIRYNFIAKNYKHGDEIKKLGPGGYFKFTIRMKSSTGYSDILPYMLYSENSTQVDVAFNDVQLNLTESEYPSNPRVGFKYILVQDQFLTKNNSEQMRIDRVKGLDDEHTPGVFETFSVRTPTLNHTDQSFIQWKPICYTGVKRDVIDSVDVWAYPLKNASSVQGDDDIQDSILYSYYGKEIDKLLLESMNISFGTKGDGYYNKTKHISWTYSTGFGEPPKDYVSLLVFLIIGVGLGIPTLIIIVSVIYVLTKRCKQPRDDLLLGR